MFEHDYRNEFDAITPDRALVERTRGRMRAVLSGGERSPRRLTRRGIIAVAAAAALTVTALAAGPTIWQAIQNDLGSRAPYDTEVKAACEDQGIRLEGVQALADGRMVRVYFTARDLNGNRLDETTQIRGTLIRTDRNIWPYGSYSVRQLSYDPDSRTCLFVLTATGRENVPEDATLCLDVERLLGGYQSVSQRISTSSEHGGITEELLPSTRTQEGSTVLLPQPELESANAAGAPFSIVAAGFAADGNLHVRVRPAIRTAWQNIVVSATILKDDGAGVGHDLGKVTPIDGDLDYCLEGFGPEQLSRLTMIEMTADYSRLSEPVEGDWSLEIPLQIVEAEHIPVSLALPADQVSDGTVMAQRLELSPLSLTLVCDQDTMYLEEETRLRSVTLEKFIPEVLLKNGTTLTPTYADGNSWWATWTFDQPIDLDQVVSITINEQTIPVDKR
ncbi:hypothetical protein [Flavonifractor sp. AGMB03687]|uniref:hypothetical protein n=1 Tax=Flavonifractor sp. AGMB03687 TaxID=2785133 RepID=UPI001AE0CC4E|nr:hypothetical protein [Flavonifractor sp. AGMB03687]